MILESRRDNTQQLTEKEYRYQIKVPRLEQTSMGTSFSVFNEPCTHLAVDLNTATCVCTGVYEIMEQTKKELLKASGVDVTIAKASVKSLPHVVLS